MDDQLVLAPVGGTMGDMPLPDLAGQHGCCTGEQALAAGWTSWALERAVRRGELVRLRRAVYVAADTLAATTGPAHHAVLVRGAQLALGPRWHAARRTALHLASVPMIGSPPAVPQLLAAPLRSSERARTRHERIAALARSECTSLRGIPVVIAPRALLDVARAEPFRNGVVVADALLASGLSRAELEATLDRQAGWPGSATARRVVAFADGLAESPLESISRVAQYELGLPAPELQVEVWLGDVLLARVDALWRDRLTVGEADGLEKYGTDVRAVRAALVAERARQELLCAVGLEVVRWTWDEAWRPAGVLDVKVRRAFERACSRQLDPRVRFVTTSVADRLRGRTLVA